MFIGLETIFIEKGSVLLLSPDTTFGIMGNILAERGRNYIFRKRGVLAIRVGY